MRSQGRLGNLGEPPSPCGTLVQGFRKRIATPALERTGSPSSGEPPPAGGTPRRGARKVSSRERQANAMQQQRDAERPRPRAKDLALLARTAQSAKPRQLGQNDPPAEGLSLANAQNPAPRRLSLRGCNVMRQRGADTLITEEPDDSNRSRPDLWGAWPGNRLGLPGNPIH